MPTIKLTADERKQHLCELCNRPADLYLVRQIANNLFACYRCVRPTSLG